LRGMLADRPRAVAALTKIFLTEIARLLDAAAAADMLAWENSGFQSMRASGSRSSTMTCPAIFRASNICCGTAPGRPSRSNDSP